jgi:stage V sporulation protein R
MIGTAIPAYLVKAKEEIKQIAISYGLDFFETIFEYIDYKQVNEVASYGGFPTRYSHWRFGMEYDRMSKSYEYGLHKIYEMVINNNPCYAYLLRSNSLVDQKLVIAHVYAHCDFFKNNMYFANTNRKMIDEMANHATRISRYMDVFGIDLVEKFIDSCLSIDNLIDYQTSKMKMQTNEDYKLEEDELVVHKIKSKSYMDKYINPKTFLEAQKQKVEDSKKQEKKIPHKPERDVLLFLLEYAPLENWQRDILSIIREEAYYFAPQGQTKIMNEGWASYWHSKIMTQKVLKDSEIIDFADHHSGTVAMAPGQMNPYKIGLELFKDIEERYNKGLFGKEYEECEDIKIKNSWDKKLNQGRDKIFEVRKIYNDVTFLDAFLTREFCEKFKLFTFDVNKKTNNWEISSRDFNKIKQKLLFQLTNFGQPFIFVEDANYNNKGELMLVHRHEGVDLKLSETRKVLEHLNFIWNRPVNLKTVYKEKESIFVFDGKEHQILN